MKLNPVEPTAEGERSGWKVVDPCECEMADSGYLEEGKDERFRFFWEFVPVFWSRFRIR